MKGLSRSKLTLCLVMVIIMLVGDIISLSDPSYAAAALVKGIHKSKGTYGPRELIPLYNNTNTDDWTKACSQSSGLGDGSWIIADVAHGPGTAPDTAWASAIDDCYMSRNASVIGYVWTNYGRDYKKGSNNDLPGIKAQIDNWYKFYRGNIAGIFFDGVSDTIPGTTTSNQEFYQKLASYVHKRRGDNGEVVFNFGANPSSGWMLNARDANNNANIVVTFEGSYNTVGTNPYTSWTQASWEWSYPANNFAAIVYDAPDTSTTPQPSSACATLTQQNLGYVYVGTWFNYVPYLPEC